MNKTNRKKSRTDKSPELKVVISCPFRVQGVGAQLPAYPAYLVSMPAALHHVVDDIAVTDEKNGETSHNQEAASKILLHLIERKLLPQTRCCGDVERRKT